MMRAAIERLAADPATAVIVLVSKPPAAAVARDVLALARASGKPVVASFVGAASGPIEAAGAFPAATLADAARLAVALARGEPYRGADAAARDPLPAGARARPGPRAASQRACAASTAAARCAHEAELILAAGDATSAGHTVIARGHTAIDLGDDEFTVGRPHPMIDFRLRNEHIAAAAADPTDRRDPARRGARLRRHPDPAGALVAGHRRGRAGDRAPAPLAFVASVCGTPGDPQDLARQEAALSAAGVILAPSNAEAARLAARSGGRRGGRRDGRGTRSAISSAASMR